jgi:hypothetical protein
MRRRATIALVFIGVTVYIVGRQIVFLLTTLGQKPGVRSFLGRVKRLCTQENLVKLIKPVCLLFVLNLIDACVTIGWVRTGLAPEGNGLMAAFLDAGNLPFLVAKLGMGAVCCAVLLYGADYKLARFGVSIALVVYMCVMGLHVGTGLAAYGFLS